MKSFKGEEVNKKIEHVIMSEVFTEFAKGGKKGFEKGKRVLNKLYLQYFNDIKDTETKRKIGYSLALAEFQLDNIENAKLYVKEIKEIAELDGVFLSKYTLEYCKILNLYAECFKDEIDEEDYRWTYNYIALSYAYIGAFSERAIALSNIYILDKDYYKLLDLLKEIIELNDEKVGYYSQELLKALKCYDISLHKKALKLIEQKGIKLA